MIINLQDNGLLKQEKEKLLSDPTLPNVKQTFDF